MNNRILFITHAADRSGAPLFLLKFIQWAKEHSSISIGVLVKKDGVLESEFSKLGSVFHWNPQYKIVKFFDKKNIWGKNKERILNNTGLTKLYRAMLLQRLQKEKYDLIFVNSFASCELIPILSKAINRPIICRAPELQYIVENFCGLDSVKASIPYIDKFVAVSNLVLDYMHNNLRISKDKIYKISLFSLEHQALEEKQIIRARLRIPSDTFVIYGSGTINWIKGTDLFIQLAACVKRKTNSKIQFIWVGGTTDHKYEKQLLHDIRMLKLDGYIHITGELENPWPVYAASDLFVLMSREDPFPQVALEAASFGIPCICFENASGVTDFVNEETGSVVPYLNIESMAEEIVNYVYNEEVLARKGRNIKQLANTYDFDFNGKELLSLIQNTQ